MFFGMEIQLKNKQNLWHKWIDSLHPYIPPSWNRILWIRTLAETLEPSMWDTASSTQPQNSNAVQIFSERRSRHLQTNIRPLQIKRFSFQNLESTLSKMLLWFSWRNSGTFLTLLLHVHWAQRKMANARLSVENSTKQELDWLYQRNSGLIELKKTCAISSCLIN